QSKVHANETPFDRNPSGRNIHDNFRNEIRIDPRRSITKGKRYDLLLECLEPAITRSPDNTNPCLIDSIEVQGSVCYRFCRGNKSILCEWIYFPDLLLFEIV